MDATTADSIYPYIKIYCDRLKIDTTNYMLYFSLSHQYLRLHRFQEAFRACLIGAEYLGITFRENTCQKCLLSSQILENLISLYYEILQVNLLDRILLLDSLSLALLISGDTTEASALNQIINSIKNQPQKTKCDSSLEAYITLGESLLNQNRWREALKVYRSALDIAPKSNYIQGKISKILLSINEDMVQPDL